MARRGTNTPTHRGDNHEKKLSLSGAAALALIAFSALAADDAPYGTSHFESYADIGSIKQLKTVWDFNFVDPKTAGGVCNNVNALRKATADFGPNEIDPLKIVIVSHGPEIVVWAKKNYAKYKDIVDRAANLAQQGVRIEICRNGVPAPNSSAAPSAAGTPV